ncbi:MAG: mannitol-1-phosphate 5-dehydrogenase [Streptococcaceae bacterium]|jgi:mannitol-1-phosphate 5-dehydrogenase|nr:mannitol-1-phosphate 5-dehydrogenase [Streptococcaceae bacterium]
MKKAVHFGAGNIGRGFIGLVLNQNGFETTFVDVNATIIDALNARHEYDIELAGEEVKKEHVDKVSGINNKDNPDAVVAAIAEADVVTTAIGPNILPFIAELIAKGIKARGTSANPIDVIACENMIGGSEFLKSEVLKFASEADLANVGFPNAAVDRIVPGQHHEDPLYVVVEPFYEWVIDESQMKNPAAKLEGVHYASDLLPFIERKLFSVNSGHATVAYNGAYAGKQTIFEALKDEAILEALKKTQSETRSLLLAKWADYFTETDLVDYHTTIISRFANPKIIDDVSRVARTPIRKLGYDERFIRPIRELSERGLSYAQHLDTVGKIFAYTDPEDPQAVELQEKLTAGDLKAVAAEVTGLPEGKLLDEVVASAEKYKK